MRHYIFLLLIGFVSLLPTPSLAVEELDTLRLQNTLLRAEYELSRKSQIYMILSLERKEIEIRTSGIKLAAIPIVEVRSWGPLPQPGLHILAEKDRMPEREMVKIPPAGGETPKPPEAPPTPPADPAAKPAEKKFDVQAYEVTDMPPNYGLWLEGGGYIQVRSLSDATDWKSKFLQRFDRQIWHVSRALISDWNYYQKKPYTELLLIMKPLDAQRIYWALSQGTSILIPPPTVAQP